jgi:hypothetical protein
VESPLVFYPRYALGIVRNHARLARWFWRLLRFRYRLKRDPESRNYTDAALAPEADSGYARS